MLSMADSEQFEAPDSSEIDNTPSSYSIVSKKRNRTSKIWDHTPVGRDEVLFNHHSKAVWRCKYCQKEYIESGGTTIIVTHLKEHKVDIASLQALRVASVQSNIDAAFQRAQEVTDRKRRCISTTTDTIDPAVFEHLYVQWITTCGIPFRMVAREEFRALLHYLNHEVDTWLPSHPATIREWTIHTFNTEKQRIKVEVQSALSKVHFTVDLWTSPNSLAIVGMIVFLHYKS
jgi:BED zinc finger